MSRSITSLVDIEDEGMSGPMTNCPRCSVTIPADKLAMPDRCADRACPTTPASELERRHAGGREDFGRTLGKVT